MPKNQLRELRNDMPLGMMLKMVAHAHDSLVREKIDKLNTPKAFGAILMHISRYEGEMQADIAAKMNFTAPTISVNIRKLEESGYIERRADEKDQRQYRVYLTESGRKLTLQMLDVFRECEETLSKGINQDDILKMRETLKIMYKNTAEDNS